MRRYSRVIGLVGNELPLGYLISLMVARSAIKVSSVETEYYGSRALTQRCMQEAGKGLRGRLKEKVTGSGKRRNGHG